MLAASFASKPLRPPPVIWTSPPGMPFWMTGAEARAVQRDREVAPDILRV